MTRVLFDRRTTPGGDGRDRFCLTGRPAVFYFINKLEIRKIFNGIKANPFQCVDRGHWETGQCNRRGPNRF